MERADHGAALEERASSIKNICVIGVGGVGGYFGGMLLHGLEETGDKERKVSLIARGEHLQEIRRSGLTIETSRKGTIVAIPAFATDRIEEIPPPDLCLLCVKSYDLTDAAGRLASVIKKETVIVPLLNGVDIYDRIRSVLKQGVVLPSCVYVGTHIERPGKVTQKGGDGIILSGPDPRAPEYDPGPLMSLFQQTGIHFTWNDDPYPAIWEKYIFIAGFGLVTAYSGKSLGEAAADPELREAAREIMEEIKLIARASHVALADDIVDASLGKATNFPFETRTSYQRDVEEKGPRNEGDLFGGTVLRLGKFFGVATPKTDSLYTAIRARLGG